MERTSTPEAHQAPSQSTTNAGPNKFRGQRGRIAAAALALLGMGGALSACGGEEPEPVPEECAIPERADAPTPRVLLKNVELSANRLRVHFDVPEFDEECRAPLAVHVMATLWRNPENVAAGEDPNLDPRSTRIQLPGETIVYAAGTDYFVDAELVPTADSISSLSLHTADNDGNEFMTAPVAIE